MITVRFTPMMLPLIAAALLLASCASPQAGGPTQAASAVPLAEQPAAGTFGDSLKACMDRIPTGASAGQQMFAEASCRRDAAARASIDAVPGQ